MADCLSSSWFGRKLELAACRQLQRRSCFTPADWPRNSHSRALCPTQPSRVELLCLIHLRIHRTTCCRRWCNSTKQFSAVRLRLLVAESVQWEPTCSLARWQPSRQREPVQSWRSVGRQPRFAGHCERAHSQSRTRATSGCARMPAHDLICVAADEFLLLWSCRLLTSFANLTADHLRENKWPGELHCSCCRRVERLVTTSCLCEIAARPSGGVAPVLPLN